MGVGGKQLVSWHLNSGELEMKSVSAFIHNLLSMKDKDVTRYIAMAVASIVAFIMVGTYLVFRTRREEEKERNDSDDTGSTSDSKKSLVRKRIGETDAYQEALSAGMKCFNDRTMPEDEESIVIKKGAEHKKGD